MREYEEYFHFWNIFMTAREQEKQLNSQVCECYKLYSCVIGIGKTALPFTNEHNSESSDTINGNISLKITGKLIYNIRWVSPQLKN